MTPEQAFTEALRLIGGKAKLAERLGITRQALTTRTRCPKCHVTVVAALASAARSAIASARPITEHDLHPEAFPKNPRGRLARRNSKP